MDNLIRIPLVDIRGGSPVDLLRQFPDHARTLARAAENTLGLVSRVASRLAVPVGDRQSRAWLMRTSNPYLNEIDAMADALKIRGVYFLNLCFEWGCTSGVWQTTDGPVLRRVLDWSFPALGENLVVAQQSGEAGDFYNITWPGLSGSYQGSAPGRFAAAINQAPMRRRGAGYIGDWARNRISVGRERGMPPAHLLRQVFEAATDYVQAKAMLCETGLAVPAIFILSGTREDEGSVIERTEDAFVVHGMSDGRVCVANHFESQLSARGRGFRPRPIDSAGRVACARALPEPEWELAWFVPPIANVNSRLAFEASAVHGALTLMGTAGPRPVTQVFRLPRSA